MLKITSKIQKYDPLSVIKTFSLSAIPIIQDKPAKRVATVKINPKSKFNLKTLHSSSKTMMNIEALATLEPTL